MGELKLMMEQGRMWRAHMCLLIFHYTHLQNKSVIAGQGLNFIDYVIVFIGSYSRVGLLIAKARKKALFQVTLENKMGR